MAIETGPADTSQVDLQDYTEWARLSPSKILGLVKTAGGWSKVFPETVPRWASRVRNHFNVTPRTLKRLGVIHAARSMLKLEEARSEYRSDDLSFMEKRALQKQLIYEDEAGRHWYMMHWASTPYHTGNGKASVWKKVATFTRGQQHTVFKLISPDGTGGSFELILKNPRRKGRAALASALGTGMPGYRGMGGKSSPEVRMGELFVPDVDLNSITRGSYNYAETAIVGLSEHERMDVKPHEATEGFYLNPPLQTGLKDRVFPRQA